MNTPLMIAIYALLALIAVPATRELLRTARENAKRARLIPIVNFADRATGLVYARLEHGKWAWRDEERISGILADPDVAAAIMAIPADRRDAAAASAGGETDLDIDDLHNLGERAR